MLPTLGTDPELVAVSQNSAVLDSLSIPQFLLHKPIPAYYALGVVDPLRPKQQLPYGEITPDGMAVEFTVHPTPSVDTMIEQLRGNLRTTRDMLTRTGCTISLEPHFETHPWYIEQFPEEYGPACSLQLLGCAPDVCIYPDVELASRPDPREYHWRTSGGHIHVQIGQDMVQDHAAQAYVVAAMDMLLGTATTYLCTSPQAYDRKKLYGQAGMMRSNMALGTIEYRTLTAQALMQTETLARMMFTGAQQVCNLLMDIYASMSQPEAIREFISLLGSYGNIVNTVVPAINTHDVSASRSVQEDFGNRLSKYSIITDIIHQLQSYEMPQDFDLHWSLT
jgi:hypothetical protein